MFSFSKNKDEDNSSSMAMTLAIPMIKKLLSNEKIVGNALLKMTEAATAWEQKNGFSESRIIIFKDAKTHMLELAVWVVQAGVSREYGRYNQNNLSELIKMFNNGDTE